MNTAIKARWANILTAVVTVIALIQGGMLTNPPFTDQAVIILGAVFTYLTLSLTAWKQYLSPDVSNTGTKVTLGIAIAVTLTAMVELLPHVSFSDTVVQWTKWGISIVVLIINVLSKQLFPSQLEKDKMADLRHH